jgi:hypothetical protein
MHLLPGFSRYDDRPLLYISVFNKLERWIEDTVDDYSMVKTRIPRVANHEKDVHEADKSNSSSPAFSINANLPRVNITITHP